MNKFDIENPNESEELKHFKNIILNKANVFYLNNNDGSYFDKLLIGNEPVQIEGSNSRKYDKLDLGIVNGKKLLAGIEVMKIDGTGNKKGSANQEKQNMFVKKFDEECKDKQEHVKQDTFSYNFSLNTYIKNFKTIFNGHVQKIEDYRDIMKKYSLEKKLDYTEAKLGFLIRDDFPDSIKFNGEKIVFSPHRCKELLDLMYSAKKIDFFLFSMNEEHGKPLLICMRNTKETYDYIIKNETFVTETTNFIMTGTTSVLAAFIDNLFIESKIDVTKEEKE